MSNKIRKLENRRKILIRNIQLCEYNKKKIIRYVQKLDDNYDKGLISYEEYYLTRNKVLEHKTVEQWINYYNGFIERYRTELSISEKEARDERNRTNIAPLAIIFSVLLILGLVAYYMGPSITGFAVFNETNITEMSAENLSETTVITNITNITNINITETNVTEPIIIDTGIPNFTSINGTKINKWYSSEKQDLEEIETIPIDTINESYSGTEPSLIINSSLLTDNYMIVYSELIPINKNKYKIVMYYKLIQMGDSIGEMVIDYFDETSLADSTVIEFNETEAWIYYGYDVGLSVTKHGDWNRLEIDLNKQENLNKIRIGPSFNMGLDRLSHKYIISDIEVK